jgi:hypothetical protein
MANKPFIIGRVLSKQSHQNSNAIPQFFDLDDPFLRAMQLPNWGRLDPDSRELVMRLMHDHAKPHAG